MKDKKCITITIAFQEILDVSNQKKANKIWVEKGSEFSNISMKSWLQDNGLEIYSTHKKWKSIAAEIFIRALKNKIYKSMTAISKYVSIDKLDNIVNTIIHVIEQSKWSLLMLSQIHILTSV